MRAGNWLQREQDRTSLYIFVSVLFAVGAVFGMLMHNALTLEQQQHLEAELVHFMEVHQAGIYPDAGESLRERALFHGKWLLLIWLLGVTVAGVPFVLALDFLKGTLVGFTIGALISQHAWKGLLFAAAAMAPANLIIIPALTMASVSAIAFSLHIVKYRLLQPGGSLAQPLLAHTASSLLMLLALWGAALFEAYLSPYLISWAAPFLTASA